MNRRGVLSALSGLSISGRPQAATGAVDGPVVLYLERLQARLADAGGGAFLDPVEARLLALHNRFRADYGAEPLSRDPDLDSAARAHVADLLARGDFGHVSPEGYSSQQRVGLLARRFLGASGENIALEKGGVRPTADQFARLWRDSPGHRANMLRQTFNRVGFGVVAAKTTTIAGVVFGQSYAELRRAAPIWVGRGEGLAGLLTGAAPDLIGYELQPLGGGGALGSFFPSDAPTLLAPGAYTLRPHVADRVIPRRYWILFGPIVFAA